MQKGLTTSRSFQRRAAGSTHRLFGVDLDAHIVDMRMSLGKDDMPYVIEAVDAFMRAQGLSTPGLFRQHVEDDELTSLRKAVEAAYHKRRRLELASLTANVHLAAALLKAYLLELPRPLLSFELYPYFLAVADRPAESAIATVTDLLSRLPPVFCTSSRVILQLLQATASENHSMDANGLSKAFAPLLLRSSQTPISSADAARAEVVLTLMITQSDPGGALFLSDGSLRDVGGGANASTNGAEGLEAVANMSIKDRPAAEAQWYYIDQQQNYVGPVSADGLLQLLVHKYVQVDTYVWADHLSGWLKLNEVPELSEGVAALVASFADDQGGPEQTAASATPPAQSPVAASVSKESRELSPSITSASPATTAYSQATSTTTQEVAGDSGSPSSSCALAEPVSRASVTVLKPDMQDAPEALDPWAADQGLRILDDKRRVRAIISDDGEVLDWKHTILAYINPDGEVGSHEMDFLGVLQDSSGQVTDRNDEFIGDYDQGRGFVRNMQGSVIAEVNKEGIVSGNGQQTAGAIQGFTFERMLQVAAYVLLIDPEYVAGY